VFAGPTVASDELQAPPSSLRAKFGSRFVVGIVLSLSSTGSPQAAKARPQM
jgi:hypothetical protein